MKIQYYIILSIVLLLSSCSDEGINPIYGCIDENACNYSSTANIDNGTCEPVLACGCEDLDPYFCDCEYSILDECGICNGPGLNEDGCCGNEVMNCNGTCIQLITYTNDIYPLFAQNNCLSCHNTGTSSGELDLSTYQGVLNGSYNGSIILNCNSENSTLITTFESGGLMCENQGICIPIYGGNLDTDFSLAITYWIMQEYPE